MEKETGCENVDVEKRQKFYLQVCLTSWRSGVSEQAKMPETKVPFTDAQLLQIAYCRTTIFNFMPSVVENDKLVAYIV